MKKWIFILLFLLSWSVGAGAYAADERDPITIIEDATNHILETLDAQRDAFTAEPALLQDLVREDLLPLIDLEYSARLILGKSGRGISPEQL